TVPAPGGGYLAYKSEDNRYHVAWLSVKGAKADVKVLTPTFPDRPEVLVAAGRPGATLLFKDGESGKPFRFQTVGADGAVSAAAPLDVPVRAQVETWAATAAPGGLYVAVVDGDSMIGSSELSASYLVWSAAGPTVRWTKGQPLKDVHATEPVFLNGK